MLRRVLAAAPPSVGACCASAFLYPTVCTVVAVAGTCCDMLAALSASEWQQYLPCMCAGSGGLSAFVSPNEGECQGPRAVDGCSCAALPFAVLIEAR